MEISRDELKVALEHGLESGWTDANSLTGYVMGWQSMKALFDEKAVAVVDAPEDPTPQIGDLVRVVANPVGFDNNPGGHTYCVGKTGFLSMDDEGDCANGIHAGPLSDFEKI